MTLMIFLKAFFFLIGNQKYLIAFEKHLNSQCIYQQDFYRQKYLFTRIARIISKDYGRNIFIPIASTYSFVQQQKYYFFLLIDLFIYSSIIIMKCQYQHSIYQSQVRSKFIQMSQNSLLASEDIPRNTLLLSVQQKNTLCFSTIPQSFKSSFNFIKDIQFLSPADPHPRKLQFRSQILCLYLIFLKNHPQQFPQLTFWLSRPLTGLYYFDRKVIEETDNYDLLISYVALRNHLGSIIKALYDHINLKEHTQSLELLSGNIQWNLSVFKNDYQWAYHFVNSRSFGYTKEYTLIPIFDMMNHSSRNDNVYQIISDLPQPSKEQINDTNQNDNFDESCTSDNDSEQQSPTKTKHINASFLDLYYHLISSQQISKGEQILIKYGNRNNMFLLQGYGFAQSFNKYESLVVFFCTKTRNFYYDQIKGDNCIKFKLKRQQFSFQILITLKKYYYQSYYKRDPTKAKIIWSVPKDKSFQTYFVSDLLRKMVQNRPKIHFLSNLTGKTELQIWEKERRDIFDNNIWFISFLAQSIGWDCSQLLQQNNFSASKYQGLKIPKSLLEYSSLQRNLKPSRI